MPEYIYPKVVRKAEFLLCFILQRIRNGIQTPKQKCFNIPEKNDWYIESVDLRNGRDLTEAEDIKKRWQEYTEELYRKDLHDPDNHDGMVTHLELDILECKAKWALEASL